MPRRQPIPSLHIPNDLERVEALCDALIERMGSGTRATAARIIGTLDRDRRDRQRAKTDPRFTARIRVGSARAAEVLTLLADAGWTLREVVDRKLPLLHLPMELKRFVRENRLEPSKALLLNRVKNQQARRELTDQVLGKMTQKQLYRAIYGGASEDLSLDKDLQWISLELSRLLGTQVKVGKTTIVIECQTTQGMNDVIERLGLQL